MNNEIRDAGRLKIAISLLDKRQTSNYMRQCRRKKLIVLDQLNIALGLFNDGQVDKFTELIAKHEGLNMPPKTCKGGDCRECKTGQRTKCPLFKPADIVVADRLGLTIRHKRKKEGD